MSWFKKQQKKEEQIAETARLEKVVSVEIENHNKVADEKVAEAREIADNFNRVINENGFSLVIKVAATRKKT
jgi:tRNA nucleotidyltransferase (CCA-adding enzyme)